ncbi:MAG TPA: HAD-IIIC family phosphatase, partial [Longimicrobiales bacterium]
MKRTGTHAEVMRRARAIEAALPEDAPRLAVLATFTAGTLAPYLTVDSHDAGFPLRPWIGPFGQLEQIVMAEDSGLWEADPAAVWIALRVEDVDPHLAVDVPDLDAGQVAARLDAVGRRAVGVARAVRERSGACILVSNLFVPPKLAFDPFDASQPDGLGHLVAASNRELARDLTDVPDAYVHDWAGFMARFGWDAAHDARMFYMARAPVGTDAQHDLARSVVRLGLGAIRPPSKCVVVDLDNTLWGGVLGDDGLRGIQLGDDYPGNVFKDVQAALLGLRRRGYLLAIASKNDDGLVREVLRAHPEMLLREEHFAAIHADWEPKARSLRAIAEELNIGLDSLVFVDDNPLERAQVAAELPMVTVVELPSQPTGYLDALRETFELDRPALLAEDRRRADMYREERERRRLNEGAGSVEEFLRGLDMCAEVGLSDAGTLARIHQLINKTNQFNLTTLRHSLDEVSRLSDAPDARVAWLRLSDRFGDSGLVCVGVLRREESATWRVDTLLMSCRVMGRHVEQAFFAYLGEQAREAGATRLAAHFIPTERNGMVRELYETLGMTLESETEDGRREYR